MFIQFWYIYRILYRFERWHVYSTPVEPLNCSSCCGPVWRVGRVHFYGHHTPYIFPLLQNLLSFTDQYD